MESPKGSEEGWFKTMDMSLLIFNENFNKNYYIRGGEKSHE